MKIKFALLLIYFLAHPVFSEETKLSIPALEANLENAFEDLESGESLSKTENIKVLSEISPVMACRKEELHLSFPKLRSFVFNLSKEELESLRLETQAIAKQKLEDALEKRNPKLLYDVALRYFYRIRAKDFAIYGGDESPLS